MTQNTTIFESSDRVISWRWQAGFLFAVWVALVGLHLNNDGLWFQGDAPRHAANGLFWWDFLTSGSISPRDYTLRYFARYPAINPVAYPPVFYLLEGVAFRALGSSPWVAKTLVLGFALLGAAYGMAWLRRWISPAAGWAAAVFLLMPTVVVLSHAIMLNVPAAALAIAALYHTRRWIDDPTNRPRQLYLAAAFGVAAILTYFLAGVVVGVMLVWLLCERRWRLLIETRTLIVAGIAAILLLPWAILVLREAPTHLNWVAPGSAGRFSSWLYYLVSMPDLVGIPVLCSATVGAVAGVWQARWRREWRFLALWVVVVYVMLSCIRAKELRYALFLAPAVVGFAAIGALSAADMVAGRFSRLHRYCRPLALSTLLVAGAVVAGRTTVPQVTGFREAAEHLRQLAPDEPVFYDGYHNGVFTYYVRAGDPDFRRRVVVGSKLLYAVALRPRVKLESYVSMPVEVVEMLRSRGGCRFLAIENGPLSLDSPPARLLREVVGGPEFEPVVSLPISAHGATRIDVYRFMPPVEPSHTADLSFPLFGPQRYTNIRPIER